MTTLVQATTGTQIQQVRELFLEYFEFLRTEVDTNVADLNEVPTVAGYRQELAGLPGDYAPPAGRLLLAQVEGESAGCVAFHKFSAGVCEVKRLWVRPRFRRQHVGRILLEGLIAEARQAGYAAMILSTADVLKEAQSLYQSVGFEHTAPYFDGPEAFMAREIFMKLDLTRQQGPA